MKKIILLLMIFFLIAVFISAQEFGAIKGTVKDAEGSPLPGVSVTLAGSKIAAMSVISSEKGNFRFLNLPVADDYTLKLE
ncbi:MAG: carboxypeptidase regulatory-like domain-containing protein, partial [Candidatus Aminicenantes bacterium]